MVAAQDGQDEGDGGLEVDVEDGAEGPVEQDEDEADAEEALRGGRVGVDVGLGLEVPLHPAAGQLGGDGEEGDQEVDEREGLEERAERLGGADDARVGLLRLLKGVRVGEVELRRDGPPHDHAQGLPHEAEEDLGLGVVGADAVEDGGDVVRAVGRVKVLILEADQADDRGKGNVPHAVGVLRDGGQHLARQGDEQEHEAAEELDRSVAEVRCRCACHTSRCGKRRGRAHI